MKALQRPGDFGGGGGKEGIFLLKMALLPLSCTQSQLFYQYVCFCTYNILCVCSYVCCIVCYLPLVRKNGLGRLPEVKLPINQSMIISVEVLLPLYLNYPLNLFPRKIPGYPLRVISCQCSAKLIINCCTLY